MFTVLNKDVKSSAYLSVVACFLLIPLLVNARDLEPSGGDEKCLYSTNVIHESYEDYLNNRASGVQKTKLHPRKIQAHPSKSKSSAYKKTATPGNKIIFITYTVKKKDTLTKIAKKFNITVSTIQKYNRLNDQRIIRSGMILKIPKSNTAINATKSENDSLYEIKGTKPRFRWPVPHIVEYKGDGLDGVKPIGIIITSLPGSKVLSSASGMVKKIGSMRGFGKYIVINHAGRFNTVYSNLSEILVSEGHSVQSGNIIGRIHSSEKKLHFQIDLEGKPENPLKYLPKNI
jgi:murein DD-endopeptidase MepM/ murein hydrolase activator NlpD